MNVDTLNNRMSQFRISTILFLLMVTLVASSCSSSRRAAREGNKKDMTDNQKILDALTRRPFDYKFLNARAKVRLESPDINITGNVQIRIKSGEAIWASVTKFGLEAFRLHMTRDTVRVIDRLNRMYVEESIESWMKTYQLPFRLGDVESILLGKGLIPDESIYHIVSDEVRAEVSVQFRDFLVQYILQNMIQPQLVEMDIKDPEGQTIRMSHSDFSFIKPGSGEFPLHRDIRKVSGDLPFDRLEITFNEVKLDEEKSMPFEIPRRYARMVP